MQAEALLIHPAMVFVTGRAGGGKTTTVVDVIDRVFRPQIDRMVVCCPTWLTQSTFRPIRNMVDLSRDILECNPNSFQKRNIKDPFKGFFKSIVKQRTLAHEKGVESPKTLLFIDDMGGEKSQHERLGYLTRLAVQYRHLNLSIILISQQPKLTVNAVRQNLSAAICFPPTSTNGANWLHEELNMNRIPKKEFDFMIDSAWAGGLNTRKELGQHFLFVVVVPRKPARYFIDFSSELKCDLEEELPTYKIKKNGKKRPRVDGVEKDDAPEHKKRKTE